MLAHVAGVRHHYATQAINSGPKQVQYPVAVVNPDNEVECGRKILLDGTPSAKQDSADYFTSGWLCTESGNIPFTHCMCMYSLTACRYRPAGWTASLPQATRHSVLLLSEALASHILVLCAIAPS